MPPKCAEYAATVVRAAGAAAYDAAVVAQLTKKLNMPMRVAGEVAIRMRKRRGQETWTTPGGLELVPGVSVYTGQAFLKCSAGGELRWQRTPAEAEQHAGHVLQVVGAAEDDTHYLAVLGELEIEMPRARAMVEDIINFR